MADMDEELDSLFSDSSIEDGEMDDFLGMVEDEDSYDIFSDDESSFVDADLDADDGDSFGMSDDWEDVKQAASDNVVQDGDFKTDSSDEEAVFSDVDNLFADIDDDEPNVPEPVQKMTFFQKIKAVFKPKLTEAQIEARKAEEAEEAEYAEKVSAKKDEKKKIKAEAKNAAKEDADRKKQAKKDAKAAKASAKKAETNKKKAQKAAKKAEKNAIPVPKSQIVPIAPLAVFIVLGIAASVVIILGSNTKFYSANVKEAKELFIHQKYDKAYQNMLGLDIKEKDKKLYEQVEIVNFVDNKLQNYYSYKDIGRYEEALDSLLGGIRKYNEYSDKAENLGLYNEFESIYNEIAAQLNDEFCLSLEQANSILQMTHSEYSNNVELYAKEAAVRDGIIEVNTNLEDTDSEDANGN